MARGYARGRASDDAARAALKPLQPGAPCCRDDRGLVALVFALGNLISCSPVWRSAASGRR